MKVDLLRTSGVVVTYDSEQKTVDITVRHGIIEMDDQPSGLNVLLTEIDIGEGWHFGSNASSKEN